MDDHRFRIEHAQIIHPDDQARIHALGIIPSVQPTHATSDMSYAETRLGKDRTSDEAYRMRSLLDARLVLGSDFPVEPPNPFQGIYAAVTRKSPHTGEAPAGFPNGWYATESLDLDQAIRGFTEGPAYGGFMVCNSWTLCFFFCHSEFTGVGNSHNKTLPVTQSPPYLYGALGRLARYRTGSEMSAKLFVFAKTSLTNTDFHTERQGWRHQTRVVR